MTTITAHHPKTIERSAQWLRVTAVGLGALLLLAAAADQRNGITDRTSGHTQRVERQVAPSSTEGLVQEMLTHD